MTDLFAHLFTCPTPPDGRDGAVLKVRAALRAFLGVGARRGERRGQGRLLPFDSPAKPGTAARLSGGAHHAAPGDCAFVGSPGLTLGSLASPGDSPGDCFPHPVMVGSLFHDGRSVTRAR